MNKLPVCNEDGKWWGTPNLTFRCVPIKCGKVKKVLKY